MGTELRSGQTLAQAGLQTPHVVAKEREKKKIQKERNIISTPFTCLFLSFLRCIRLTHPDSSSLHKEVCGEGDGS